MCIIKAHSNFYIKNNLGWRTGTGKKDKRRKTSRLVRRLLKLIIHGRDDGNLD